MRRKISRFLIIVGLLIAIIPQGLKYYSKQVEKDSIERFQEAIKEDNSEQKDFNIGDEIAIIKIKSLDLETVIVEGTDEEYLKYYVCHFEETAMPGEYGNFCIAGHSSYWYNQVFKKLSNAKINDEIEIETVKGSFIYKIKEIFDTEAENTSVLSQRMDKKEITLITCTDGGKKRLIVKGEIQG